MAGGPVIGIAVSRGKLAPFIAQFAGRPGERDGNH